MTAIQKVGFLGLGNMGLPLATRLISDDIDLTVWNRTASKCDPFATKGIRVANTPAEAASGADIVISIVTDDAASEAVWLGGKGALNAANPGCVMVEMSTLSPGWSRRLAEEVAGRNANYLEAPVAGGPQAAADGTAMLLVGGEPAALEKAGDVLLRMAAKYIHIGPAGTATALKLARNLLLGIEIVGLAEILTLAQSAGISRDVLVRSIVEGPTASPVIKGIIEPMVDGGGGDAFAIDILRKDIEYGIEQGALHGTPLSISEAVRDVLLKAGEMGVGGKDVSSLARVIAGFKTS